MEFDPPSTQQNAVKASPAVHLPAPLRAFVLLAKHLGIAVHADGLIHERGTGDARWTLEDLARAAKQMGLQARIRTASMDDLAALPLPVLAVGNDGEDGAQRSVLLLRVEPDVSQPRYLVQSGSSDRPEVWSAAEAAQYLAGPILLLNNSAHAVGRDRPFDISWFIPALVKYRSPLRDVLIASFFLQLLGLASPIFFQLVIDKVLVNQAMTTLTVLAIGFAVTLLFETALSGLRNWLFAHTSNRVDAELSAQLFRHLTALPLSYFESRRVGDTIARVRELESIREFLTSNAVTVVIDLFFTILFFIVMYHYAPGLTLIVLCSLPCYAVISFAISGPLRRMLEEKFRRGAESQSFLVESVTAILTLKSMAIEPQMRDRWERLFAAHAGIGFDAAKLANWGSHLIQLVSKLTMLAILYFGATAVIAGTLSVGGLIAFNMLAGRVAGPVLRLSQLWQDFQQARIAVDRLGDVINTPTEFSHRTGQSSLPDIRGAIIVDKIRFRYRPGGAEALRGLDLNIAAGEMIGITGPSGSGKSTLTKLIQRLYVPEQGRILIDGMDLAMADPSWLRRQIGVVQQETILFSRTVRENIALADPALPLEAVIAAARLAGAHEFILQMPMGYDSLIDERGGNLSGGQRQRIAIARALINDPPVLIFDEATSALDAESEAVVQRNLAAIAAGRTMIIIAHRLSAIRTCNRIVTVEGGVVTEIGRHDELLLAGGRYAKLFAAQSGSVTGDERV